MGGRRNRAASATARTRPGGGRGPKPAPATVYQWPVFEILQSKLLIPSLRPGLVPRTALVNRLRTSYDARVVSIAAPAGYGKTTLLAQWAARDPRPFAWVSLEHRDDDPVALLTYIAAALDRVPPIDQAVFRGAAASNHSLWSTGLPRLGAALAATPEPIVLVLDDVHELRHRDCVDALETLTKHLSAGSQLVLSGRAESKVRLARIRADRRLLEIGPSDLALSDSDARSLLTTAGTKVSAADAHELNRRAEGWIAGLHLATMFTREADDPDAILSFAGNDRFVADYLRTEHLSRLRRDDREFLKRTAVLDRMCGPLCDEVLECSDSARKLEALEDANVLVVALDHHQEWYRYHHLFQEMLRSEIEQREPKLVTTLRRRAASWCERHGQPEAAIEYATAGGDVDELARLVSTHALPFFRNGHVATVERWVRRFDDPELLIAYPTVAAFGALVHALRGRAEDAERFANALEHTDYDGPMPDGSESPQAWAGFVRAWLCRHGVAKMRVDAELALAELSPSSFWRAGALLISAVGVLLEGEVERAEELFDEAAVEAVGAGAVYAGIVAHAELALLALERRDRDKAALELAHAEEFLQNHPVEEYGLAALERVASARLALELGQAATARKLLVSAMRMRVRSSRAIPWLRVQTGLELARTHLALADVGGARKLLRETEDVIQHRPEMGTLRAQVREFRGELVSVSSLDNGWASTLTAAELRLLPLLTTHLSLREIAERLFVSRNTVKTQAISVYRKLHASSRSEAVERAVELGLVDSPVPPPVSERS